MSGSGAEAEPGPKARIDWPKLGRMALALAIGTVGGALAWWLELPLAWMIGAMIFTTIASMSGAPLGIAPTFRGIMVAILGVMLGSAFSPEMAGRIVDWWPTLTVLAVYCAAVTAALALYFRYVAGHDWVTSYFSAAPGGLTEMVIVGGAMGGDERTISLVHGARVLMVVLTVPFGFVLLTGYDQSARPPIGDVFSETSSADLAILAACAIVGGFAAKRLRIPAAFVTGPMILSAIVHITGMTASKPPAELVAGAQVVMGSAVGSRFAGVPVRKVLRTLFEAIGSTTVMLAFTVAFAFALEPLAETSIEAIVLAFAPGGLAEMSLIALALAIDAAFVSSHHIVRIVMIVIAAPMFFRWTRAIAAKRQGAAKRKGRS